MIYTDCDEIIIADPSKFSNLRIYIEQLDSETVRPIGLDLLHLRSREAPIDPKRPILDQRHYCQFRSGIA